MLRDRISLFLCLLLLPLLALPAVAAEVPASDQTPPSVFGETVEVRVVNVEVVVTDRDGNRVLGLQPEDFRLFVDGEETPVSYFSEIAGGEVQHGAGSAAPVPGVPAAGEDDAAVGTSYLVFIDDFFSLARDRNQVLADLREDLPLLGPNDRMAVVAYDGSRVEMLTSWTRSPSELERTLKAAADRPAYGLQRLGELRTYGRFLRFRDGDRLRYGNVSSGPFDVDVETRSFAGRVERQVRHSVEAAVASLRGFAMPPGRKVMLLLSGGWPYDAVAYAIGYQPGISLHDVATGHELFAPLVDTANLLGYTLYPVDVPGMGVVGQSSAVDVAYESAGGLARTRVAFDRENTLEQSLRHIAQRTGGEPLINSQSHRAMERVEQDTRSYYWLGFTPERQRDDRRHVIRVRVDRPGVEVRTRESFLDMSTDTERTLAVESALLFGEAAADGRLIAETGAAQRTGRRTMTLPVQITIPSDLITPVPVGEDAWAAQLELRVAALDERDQRSDVPSIPIELRFKGEPDPQASFTYDTTLQLRRIDQDLVLHVTDPVSGRSATTQLAVAKVR